MQRYVESYAQRLEREEREKAKAKSKGFLVDKIHARQARKMDTRIVITGEGGVGKSTLELRLGELVNPEIYVLNIEKAVGEAVSFTAKQYMTGVRTLPTDTQLSYDEPGQSWYHRQFMSQTNMILSKTTIGFRWKRFITVLCVPNLDLLDVDAIRLVNYMCFIPEQGKAEVFRVMKQKFGGAPWYKKIIDRLTFTKPDIKLWHMYEKRKFKEQDELYERFGKELDEMETPKLTDSEILAKIEGDPSKYMKGGRFSVPYIQREFRVGLNRGYLIKAILEREDEDKAEPVDKL